VGSRSAPTPPARPYFQFRFSISGVADFCGSASHGLRLSPPDALHLDHQSPGRLHATGFQQTHTQAALDAATARAGLAGY
jgi:hypothetical protein